jgi:release factor glutamine methyltransferase
MNVAQALQRARQHGVDRLDATLLLAHHLQRRREWVLAHADDELPDGALAAFYADCARRADGVPLAYLTGTREFMGLTLQVTPDVLVPRPETELLAGWAIECLRAMPAAQSRHKVVDLGTGSGALALAIAAACPGVDIVAVDSSVRALAVARANAERLGLAVRFAQGDWWDALGGAAMDLAVANPPYVAEDDEHLAALRHEPRGALAAGPHGLDALYRIVVAAPRHLRGWLLVEHGWNQAVAVRDMMANAGLTRIETRSDLAGQPRCTGARIA